MCVVILATSVYIRHAERSGNQAKRYFHEEQPCRSIACSCPPFSPKPVLMFPCSLPNPRHRSRFARHSQFGGDDDVDADLDKTGLRFADMSFGVSPQTSGHASPIKPIPAPSKGRGSGGGVFGAQGVTGGRGAASAATRNGTGGKKPPFSGASSAVAADKGAAGALEMHEEQLSAERAFDSMDQNSGRVSTRRLEELLTLLGTPASRSRDATESARAAGLLSSPSFTRQDFVNWCVS